MKKKLLFIFLAIFVLFACVGCEVVKTGDINDKLPTTDVESGEVYAFIIAELKDTNQVTEDLNLPTKFKDMDLTWSSSNESVLSSTGKVNRQDKDVKVVLTCTLTENGEQKSYDFVATVKAKENEVVNDPISITEAKAKGEGADVKTIGVVKAVSAVSFLIEDSSDSILVYIGPSFAKDVTVGDEVTVEGKLSLYGGLLQISGLSYTKGAKKTVNYPTPKELSSFDELKTEELKITYVKFQARLGMSGNYYNLTIAESTLVGSLATPLEDMTSLNGKLLEITGYFTYIVSDKYAYFILTGYTEIEETQPIAGVKISEVFSGTIGNTYKVNATVVAVSKLSFLVKDDTGYILAYMGTSFTGGVKVGDIVELVGETSVYSDTIQFNNPKYEVKESGTVTQPEPRAIDASSIEGLKFYDYVTVEGVLTISGNYTNLAIDGTTLIGSIVGPLDDLSSLNNKKVEVTGYYLYLVNNKYVNFITTSIKEVDEPIPPLEVTPISAVLSGEVGSRYKIEGLVEGVSKVSFIVGDDSGDILVYMGNSFEGGVEVGDFVTVEGLSSSYSNTIQISTPTFEVTAKYSLTFPEPTVITSENISSLSEISYCKLVGTLSVSGNYVNVIIDGTDYIGSLISPVQDVTELDGKKVEVTGVFVYIVNGKYVNFIVSEIKLAEEENPITDVVPISTVLSGTVGATYKVEGLVVAVSNVSFLVVDPTGFILAYVGKDYEARLDQIVKVGDFVTLEGETSSYSNTIQFSNPRWEVDGTYAISMPEPREITSDNIFSLETVDYCQVEGVLSISGDYINLAIDGTGLIGSIISPIQDVTKFDGMKVVIKGWFVYIVNNLYVNFILDEIALVEDVPQVITTSTISTVLDSPVGNTYKVEGTVIAVSKLSFIVSDDTNSILAYFGPNFEGGVKVGDYVTLEGVTSSYSNTIQFSNPEFEVTGSSYVIFDEPLEVTADNIESLNTIIYCDIKGLLVTSGNYVNLVIDNSELVGSIIGPIQDITEFNNKKVEVKGFFVYIVNNTYANFIATEITLLDEDTPTLDLVKIENVKCGTVGDEYKTEGFVLAVSNLSFIVSDETESILVYFGPGFEGGVQVGDYVSIQGITSTYSDTIQFSSPTFEVLEHYELSFGNPREVTGENIENLNNIAHCKVVGTLSISGNYVNLAIDGTELIGSLISPIQDVTEFDGKKVAVDGYFVYIVNNKYVNFIVNEITLLDEDTPTLDLVKIENVKCGTVGDEYKTEGFVLAVSNLSFIVSDETESILVYFGPGFEGGVQVGDYVSIQGITSTYSDTIQFSSPTFEVLEHYELSFGNPREVTGENIENLNNIAHCKVVGTLSISGNYVNLAIDGTELIGSLISPIQDVTEFDGKKVAVDGYFVYIVNNKYVNFIVNDIKLYEEEESSTVEIIDVLNGLVGDTYKTEGLVVAVSNVSFLVSDITADILVYMGNDFTGGVNVGDYVTIEGATTTYSGTVQFSKPEFVVTDSYSVVFPEAMLLTSSDFESLSDTTYCKVQGTLSVSGNYVDLTFEGTELVGSLISPIQDVTEFDGKKVEVTGFFVYIVNNKYVNFIVTNIEEMVDAPLFTVAKALEVNDGVWTLILDFELDSSIENPVITPQNLVAFGYLDGISELDNYSEESIILSDWSNVTFYQYDHYFHIEVTVPRDLLIKYTSEYYYSANHKGGIAIDLYWTLYSNDIDISSEDNYVGSYYFFRSFLDVLETVGDGSYENPLTVADALLVSEYLDKEVYTNDFFYIEGTISDDPTSDYCDFHLASGDKLLLCYGLFTFDGEYQYGSVKNLISGLPVVKGDKVLLYAKIYHYYKEATNEEIYELISACLIEVNDVEATYTLKEDEQSISHDGTEDDPFDGVDAYNYISNLSEGETSLNGFYVEAYVLGEVTSDYYNFYISAGDSNLLVYGLYTMDALYKYGSAYNKVVDVEIVDGDKVLLYAYLTKYVNKNTGEVIFELKEAALLKLNDVDVFYELKEESHQEATHLGTIDDPLDATDAIILCSKLDPLKKEISEDKYYIIGVIVDDPTSDYCNFNFSDGTTNILAYGLSQDAEFKVRYGTKRQIAELPVACGDTVLVCANLQNYNGKLEMVNAQLIQVYSNND